jgi:hypothetical protein
MTTPSEANVERMRMWYSRRMSGMAGSDDLAAEAVAKACAEPPNCPLCGRPNGGVHHRDCPLPAYLATVGR